MDENSENRRNQIDRYVQGKMEAEEIIAFEQRMREHVGLAETVHLHRDVLHGLEYHFMEQLKQKLAASDLPADKGLPLWAIALIIVSGLGILAAIAYLAGWIEL